jgi:hypothetical protein
VIVGLSLPKLLPLIQQIGNYLKMGADHYADLRSAGQEASPDVIALFLQMKMSDWNPEVGGKTLLDDETRAAAARFLAGVAVNFSKA